MHCFHKQQKSSVDEAYNVGTGEETSTRNVFDLVKKALHEKTTIGEAHYADLRPGELERSCLDISKLKSTGWSPQWKFPQGVFQTVSQYLSFEKGMG